MPQRPWHPESLAARLPFLRRRTLLAAATRAFFAGRGYAEVETPFAVATPGEELRPGLEPGGVFGIRPSGGGADELGSDRADPAPTTTKSAWRAALLRTLTK